jgi:arginase family enzyme
MLVCTLAELCSASVEGAVNHAIAFLVAAAVDRVWLHLDADWLDGELMPAGRLASRWRPAPTEAIGLDRPLVSSD